jgi:large subunit ribosomal protein L31
MVKDMALAGPPGMLLGQGELRKAVNTMKPDLHPVYPPSRIVCACGNSIETKSTRGSFHVEVCSNCHPFFTGKYKLMDTQGRIDRFKKKYESVAKKGATPAKV